MEEIKDFQNFESFYESNEFQENQNKEEKRKLFIYYALKFSAQSNSYICSLYNDLKKIIEKMERDKNDYLQKYDEDFYIKFINNYLEKIELFLARKSFFKEEKNYNALRDLIKLFNRHYKNKKECPEEVYNNLEDLYEILKIKMKHKIPEEFQSRMKRHLSEFEKMLKDLKKENPRPIGEGKNELNEEKKNIPRNANDSSNTIENIINNNNKVSYLNNINTNQNMNNNNYILYKNDGMKQNILNNNVMMPPPGIYVPMMNGPQNYNNYIPAINYNNFPNNQLNQFNNPMNSSSDYRKYNAQQNYINQNVLNNLNNLNIKDNNNDHDSFSFDINESIKHEGPEYAENLLKNRNYNNNEYNNNSDYNEFIAPDDLNEQNELKKSEQFTNERESLRKSQKSNIILENPYKQDNEKNNNKLEDNNKNIINNKEIQNKNFYNKNNSNNSAKNKKVKKSVIERRKLYEQVGKGLKKLTESDFD